VNDDPLLSGEILFEIMTPLSFSIRTTASYWELITTIKPPVMRDRLQEVQQTLASPDEIRLSKSSDRVYLFYREDGARRWVCAVTKQVDEMGFLITAYRTSAIKEGEVLWQR
jgi:hypothetical protein